MEVAGNKVAGSICKLAAGLGIGDEGAVDGSEEAVGNVHVMSMALDTLAYGCGRSNLGRNWKTLGMFDGIEALVRIPIVCIGSSISSSSSS